MQLYVYRGVGRGERRGAIEGLGEGRGALNVSLKGCTAVFVSSLQKETVTCCVVLSVFISIAETCTTSLHLFSLSFLLPSPSTSSHPLPYPLPPPPLTSLSPPPLPPPYPLFPSLSPPPSPPGFNGPSNGQASGSTGQFR